MKKPKLIGYIRRANPKHKVIMSRDRTKLNISLNVKALEECQKWQSSTGEEFVILDIDMDALERLFLGVMDVTTVMSGTLGEE